MPKPSPAERAPGLWWLRHRRRAGVGMRPSRRRVRVIRCRLATFFARVVGAACYEQSVGCAEQVVGDSTGAEPAVACDMQLGVDDAWV